MASIGKANLLGYEAFQIGQRPEGVNVEAKPFPLLADRDVVIRVYLEPTDVKRSVSIAGVLKLRGVSKVIPSANTVYLFKVGEDGHPTQHPTISEQRQDTSAALMFVVDAATVKGAKLEVESLRIMSSANPKDKVDLSDAKLAQVSTSAKGSFEVVDGRELGLHVMGFRTRSRTGAGDVIDLPDRYHFDAIKSYISRAFPVVKKSFHWRHMTVDAPPEVTRPYIGEQSVGANVVWRARHDLASAYLMALRMCHVNEGVHPRKLYYGLIRDPDAHFIGAVSDIPETPDPTVVGVGPAIRDGAYGAHEIAHMLGSLHPGFPDKQRREDAGIPEGWRGNLDAYGDGYHGFDMGREGRPQVLDGRQYYDLMTYMSPPRRPSLWPSSYRLAELMDKLEALKKVAAPRPGDDGTVEALAVVGTYTLSRIDLTPIGLVNQMRYFIPGRMVPSQEATDGRDALVEIRCIYLDGTATKRFPTSPKRQEALDLHRESGAFMVVVPASSQLKEIQLWANGELADRLQITSTTENSGVASARLGSLFALPDGGYEISIDWSEGSPPPPYRLTAEIAAVDGAHVPGNNPQDSGPNQHDERPATIAIGLRPETTRVYVDTIQAKAGTTYKFTLYRLDGLGEQQVDTQNLILP